MNVTVYKTDGTSSDKQVELNDSIFAVEPNETLIYEDVRRYLANKRQGTASTKERGDVRGGGRKAYRQKGTGMARRGSIRSPLLRGGGITFGPKPRKYTVRMTKKMKKNARKSALSLSVAENYIKVVEDFSYDEPKTRNIAELIEAFESTGKKVLILTADNDRNIYKSANNIPGVEVLEANKPTTYQIINADLILIQESGISVLENSINSKTKEEEAA